MSVLRGASLAVGGFWYGWWLAQRRHPGALAIGDKVSIKHGGTIVGRMILTEYTRNFDRSSTAMMEDVSAYMKARRVS